MTKGLMDLLRGKSKNSWHPVTGVDTTTSGYWLTWRAVLCYVWIVTSMFMASYFIKKYEGTTDRTSNGEEGGNDDDDDYRVVYDEDVWKPCLKQIHPVWLLVFRVSAFLVLLLLIILNVVAYGGKIFYYYTDLTFSLLVIYFGLGSLLSMYGCYHRHIGHEDRRHPPQVSGFWGYSFQVIFQIVAGAVVLTDSIFWFILIPFLVKNDSGVFSFLSISLHSINIVLLLGEACLNNLRFPWFRIAYFILWTCVFVIFQWIVHARITLGWPYPFLDFTSKLSPLWYLLVALLHIPCYGVFFLVIIKIEEFSLVEDFLKRWIKLL